MSYDFLKKAKLQPDLNDFCEYLKKPLSILEEIQTHYKQLQLTKKVDPSNLETYHKIDVILEKHLPEMVDTYCDFSFDYRNSKSIDINSISITPKELLLKNLAKIIEEIEVIEKDFNRNNSFNAVIQNKVLENYGHKPELCLESGKIVNNNLQLDNKFDYEEFTKNHQFKKPNLVKELEPEPEIIPIKEEEEVAEVSSGFGFNLIEVVLGLSMVTMLSVVTVHMYRNTVDEQESQHFQHNVMKIQAGVRTLYANSTNTKGLNNKVVTEALIATKEQLTPPWDKTQTINISSTSLEKDNDSILMEVPLNKDNLEKSCSVNFAAAAQTFNVIKIGNEVVKDSVNTDISKFLTACLSGEHKTISLIDKL
jgi:Tfp pilus assembly protein PilE